MVAVIGTTSIRVVSATYCPDPTNDFEGYLIESQSGSNGINPTTLDEINLTYRFTTSEPDPSAPGQTISVAYQCETSLVKN